jgi:hypothetical protein
MGTAAAEFFPHVRIVMGMVIGLGITRLLMGLAVLIQHPQHRPKLSAVHLLWVGSILLEMILFWWWEFELYRLEDWSFGVFFSFSTPSRFSCSPPCSSPTRSRNTTATRTSS